MMHYFKCNTKTKDSFLTKYSTKPWLKTNLSIKGKCCMLCLFCCNYLIIDVCVLFYVIYQNNYAAEFMIEKCSLFAKQHHIAMMNRNCKMFSKMFGICQVTADMIIRHSKMHF